MKSEDDIGEDGRGIEKTSVEKDAKLSEELYWLRYYEMLRGKPKENAKLREEETYCLSDCDDMLWEEDEAAWMEYNEEIEEEKGSSRCSEEEQDVNDSEDEDILHVRAMSSRVPGTC